MASRWSALASLTGVLAVVLAVAGAIVAGEAPDLDDPAREVVAFYEENDSEQILGSVLLAWSALFLVYFAAMLSHALRMPLPSVLPGLVLAGGVLMALGLLLFAGIGFTLGDAADDLPPDAVQALHALNIDLFFPVAVGATVLFLSAGLGILRSGALPRWLGVLAVLIGILAATPIGFFALLVGGIWILAASLLLWRAGSREDVAGPTGTPPSVG